MLARLKEPLDPYHQRRADKHGYLYIIQGTREHGIVMSPGWIPHKYKALYEARSIATGVICTFRPECMELIGDTCIGADNVHTP